MRLIVPVLTRLLAALAALALLAAGVVILVELIANATGNGFVILPEDWPDRLRTTGLGRHPRTQPAHRCARRGRVLILVACWPHPPLTVPTNQPAVRMERHALEDAVRRRLSAVDGATGAQSARDDASHRRTRRHHATDAAGTGP